mgnify:CR=1 FL=1
MTVVMMMGVNTDGVQMPPFAQHVAEGGVAGDCFRAAVATDVAVQAENVVACSHHQMQVVADHQDGGTFAALPVADGLVVVAERHRIDARRRFVQHDEVGAAQHGARQEQALRFATGQGLQRGVQQVGDVEPREPGAFCRLRDVAGAPEANVSAFVVDDGGATGTWYTHSQRAYAKPTSEFNSHLAVHNDQVEHRGVGVQAVIHAQPPYLVQLSHIKAIRSTKEFNRRILRWEPETIVQIPAGIEVLDFMVPGSQTLMENNVRALRDHVIVLWSKHGIMVRSDDSPLAAVDKVEYAETGAMYEVRNMMAGGLGEGVTDAELRAVAEAFGVETDLF